MLQKLCSLFLAMIILLPKAHATQRLNPSGILQVSPEVMAQMLDRGAKSTRILLAQNDDPAEVAAKKKKEEEEKEKEKENLPQATEAPVEDNRSSTMDPDIFTGVHVGGGGGGRETALVVFAVVGLVMIIAWIPYFPVLMYDYFTGEKKNFRRLQYFSLQSTPLISTSGNDGYPRSGNFTSARYSFFIERKHDETFSIPGFSLESGYYLLKQKNIFNREERQEGGYILAGPSLQFGENPFFGKLDLLAGSSFDRDLGLISKAEISLNGVFSNNMTLGVSLGAIYIHVRDREGVLTHSDDLGLSLGITTGIIFN